MSEILVAVIAGAALIIGSGLTGIVGYMSATYQVKRIAAKRDAAEDAKREELLWEQARKFWDDRAQALVNEVELERTARKAGEAALTADIALLKQDNAKLRQAHQECEEKTTKLEARLYRAGLSLQSEDA